MRQSPRALGLAAALALASIGDAYGFSAHFSWSGIGACGGTSPAFAISDAPKGTASLRFKMRDKDAPRFQHGGGSVPYAGGGSVPQAAINYIGPRPPAGAPHRYVWTIEALDKDGKTLARASAEGPFPPP